MLASCKELTVLTSLPGVPIHADVDQASFRRMLLILLDNAIKYTAPGGAVTIRAIEDEGQVAIVVQDTGAGIPTDQLPFIFDRFGEPIRCVHEMPGGTGLGLAIAREIAESHHAELSVDSRMSVKDRRSPFGSSVEPGNWRRCAHRVDRPRSVASLSFALAMNS